MLVTIEQQATFKRDGYIRLKGVFRPGEVEEFRRLASQFPRTPNFAKYAYEIPELRDCWRDPRLLEIARTLLETDTLVYFFEAHIQRFIFEPDQPVYGRHLHHDAKGSDENLLNRVHTPQADYPVIRMIAYLQDTTKFSGGLKVVPGSHLVDATHFDHPSLRLENVESEPGDLIVFTQRLLHSPYALRRKDQPDLSLMPFQEDEFYAQNRAAFLPIPIERETFIIDYGREDPLTDLFVKNRAIACKKKETGLAEYVVDGGVLDQHADASLRLRCDRGILETLTAIQKSAKSGVLTAEAEPFLRRIVKLCRAHWEVPGRHPLFTGAVPDDSIATALRICQEIGRNLKRESEAHQTRQPDDHMQALSDEAHRRFTSSPVN